MAAIVFFWVVYGKSILAPCSNELTDIGVNVMHHSTEAAQEAAMS